MTLAPGARLGPYEILAPIGAGGMGEVYRARDARLGRTVAIKILPAGHRADRGERLGLYPYICTLYDIGAHDAILKHTPPPVSSLVQSDDGERVPPPLALSPAA
jgi:serine/threonine protein kinase